MRILEVNGISLLGATHQEAVNALRAAGNQLQIVVCKGYDKSSLIHSIGSGGGMSTGFGSNSNSRLGSSRASETGSELSQSVSSLDRDDGAIDDSNANASVRECENAMKIFHRNHWINHFFFREKQANDVFESKQNERNTMHEPLDTYEIDDERVAATSEDVALINSHQALVCTKEKSTKDKVS